MPRKYKPIPAHFLRPDPKYSSRLAMTFINNLMYGGKKTVATKIFYRSLDLLREKVKEKEPLELLQQALDNVKPQVETKSRRVGGATYQVPVQVKAKRQVSLAIKWILAAARKRKGRPMHERLAAELLAAYNNEGEAVKKKEDTHKMAESNRAFAHLAY